MSDIRKYERDIDLLLAEEFTVSPTFARWFVDRTKFSGAPWQALDVHVSRSDSTGESDLEVRLRQASGDSFALLIEDKIDAPFQHDQLLRYYRRAEAAVQRRDYVDCEIILCAPQSYYE